MDWNLAIERNREALRRVLAALVAMARLDDRPTLPRHFHRAVLRLLRPAESAARRLVIVAARGLVVTLRPPRPSKPKPKSAFVQKPADLSRTVPRKLALPLFDPLRHMGRLRRPVASGVPRISVPGYSAPFPVPVRRVPAPYDQIDASRLALRLAALASALDDLPGHARRFARWQSSRAAAGAQYKSSHAARSHRVWPLRFGRPPGQRPAKSRRPDHEVHEVLRDLHWFACQALQHPDTS